MGKREVNKLFKLYSTHKSKDSEFVIVDKDGNKRPTNCLLYSEDDEGMIMEKIHPCFEGKLVEGPNAVPVMSFLSQEYIDRFSPDNVDIQHFWKRAVEHFPLLSIGASNIPITTTEEIDAATFQSAIIFGVVDEVNWILAEDHQARILEIGPGYGNIQRFVAGSPAGDENYYAIDVNPLFDHPRLYETDGKTIPTTIPYPCDLVYSFNVFQHLSKAQRTSYYRQIYEVLDYGGTFIFGNFVKTPKNSNLPCWGAVGPDGKYYVLFFKQLTVVDDIFELTKELEEIGFSVTRLRPELENQGCNYLAFKCKKLYE